MEFLRVSPPARLALVAVVCFAPHLLNAQQQSPIGEIYSSDVSVKGSVQLAGTGLEIFNGSAVTAADRAALLRLSRGGELRVCPKTSVTVNSGSTRELMYSMSEGAIEFEYELPPTADIVMTPDFRVVASGPGHAKVAVGVTKQGDTCIRNSSAPSAYIIISELLGNGTKRLEPGAEFLIHNGNLATAEESTAPCGCPRPEPPQRATEIASAPPPPVTTTAPISAPINLPQTAPASPTPADSAQGKVQVSVDAPMVFHGDGTAPDPTITLARVRLQHLPAMPMAVEPQVPIPAPVQPAKAESNTVAKGKQKKGFFGKLKAAFASFFGQH